MNRPSVGMGEHGREGVGKRGTRRLLSIEMVKLWPRCPPTSASTPQKGQVIADQLPDRANSPLRPVEGIIAYFSGKGAPKDRYRTYDTTTYCIILYGISLHGGIKSTAWYGLGLLGPAWDRYGSDCTPVL